MKRQEIIQLFEPIHPVIHKDESFSHIEMYYFEIRFLRKEIVIITQRGIGTGYINFLYSEVLNVKFTPYPYIIFELVNGGKVELQLKSGTFNVTIRCPERQTAVTNLSFVQEVANMRELQRKYFKTRKREVLDKSIRAERLVDEMIDDIYRPKLF